MLSHASNDLNKYILRDLIEMKFQNSLEWGPLVSVHENTLVKDAVQLMKEFSFKYLPIFTYKRFIGQKKVSLEYTGILSIQDVLDFLVFQKIFDDIEYPVEFDSDQGFRSYLKQLEEKFALTGIRVKEIQGRVFESKESIEECSLSPEEGLYQVIDRFIKGDHRVLVRDGENLAMITQSDVIRFLLLKEPDLFKQKAQDAAERAMKSRGPSSLNADPNQPVTVKKHVLTISKDMNTICAFKMMNIHKISTLGITNSSKELIGVISATDLLKLDWNRLEDLLLPLQDYKEFDPVVTTSASKTLKEISEIALSKKIHGVYIVDSDNHPTGIIRFSDILASIIY